MEFRSKGWGSYWSGNCVWGETAVSAGADVGCGETAVEGEVLLVGVIEVASASVGPSLARRVSVAPSLALRVGGAPSGLGALRETGG